MNSISLSRRRFGYLAGGVAASGLRASAANGWPAPTQAVSAQQVIDRVQSHARAGWSANAPAGLIAGDTGIRVTGIAAAAMPTVAVLRQAAGSGRNLIFTCEPVFFSMADGRSLPATNGWQGGAPGGRPGGGPPPQAGVAPDDPVLLAKKKLIADHNLVVYRVADHWDAGEDMSLALGDALGWSRNRLAGDPFRYELPARTLAAVLAEVTTKLNISGGMRVVGDERWPVRRVAVLAGLRPFAEMPRYLPESDLVLAGETRDWEGPEYFSDAKAAGMQKSYAQIGRVVSQDPGMSRFSRWLSSIVPEVPVQQIAVGDPYWRPRA